MLLALSMNGCHWVFSGENHNLWDFKWRQEALKHPMPAASRRANLWWGEGFSGGKKKKN